MTLFTKEAKIATATASILKEDGRDDDDAMTTPTDAPRDPLLREAADLWLRLQAAPGDEDLQEQARRWRGQSPAHERIFAATQESWELAGSMEALPPLPRARPVPFGPIHRPRRWAAGAAGMAAAACLAMMVAPSLTVMARADYRTGTGETLSVTLADGSRLKLDTASAVSLDYGEGRRGLHLLAGRAWFDVAKDRGHPFVVSAADVQVTVTGTAFDVGLVPGGMDVNLAEGGVRVAWQGGTPIAMKPGDRLHLDLPSHHAAQGEAAVLSMGSWRRHRLLLEDASLRDGITRLGRYYPGAILLTDRALGKRRVTGVFDVGDPADALKLMVRQHHATVRQITPWLMIVSK